MASKVIRKEQCPACAEQGRDTKEDNLAVYDDGHSHCYACGYHKGSKEEFNILLEENYTYEYLPHRGINKETFKFYGTLTKIDKEGKPISVGFRYSNNAYKVRLLDKKDIYTQGDDIGKAGLFGREKFSAGGLKSVTITEGEYDAHSVYQVCRSTACVSVQSSSTAVRDCSVDIDWLRSFDRIYLAFDNDAAGREAVRRVASLFDYNKVFVLKFTKYKDANAYLQNGDEDELRNIWNNAKKYLPDTVVSSFSEFKEILSKKPELGVPYPFHTLNKMTYGIRKGEVVLITAQEKVGKTELMHAIEHSLLRGTEEPIGAIFLEEPPQRHLLALAGLQLSKPVHLPDVASGPDETYVALEELVKTDDRLHVYSHFGSDDPDVLLDTIRFLVVSRKCGYILLDHISMVVSGLSGEDERRALDYISTRLAMMVKELGFSLILVSHLNDFNQTRGSRYISKVCDIQIRIERDKLNPDPIARNTINVSVIDNRYSGLTGPAGILVFNPETFEIKEPANDNFDPPKELAA